MEDRKRNSSRSNSDRAEDKTYIEHPECKRTVSSRKALLSKKPQKTYKVVVTYVPLSAEDARIKRAIIESILKKDYKK